MSNIMTNTENNHISNIRIGTKFNKINSSRFLFHTIAAAVLSSVIYTVYGSVSMDTIISIILLGCAVVLGVSTEIYE